jgi:hypothetical protein
MDLELGQGRPMSRARPQLDQPVGSPSPITWGGRGLEADPLAGQIVDPHRPLLQRAFPRIPPRIVTQIGQHHGHPVDGHIFPLHRNSQASLQGHQPRVPPRFKLMHPMFGFRQDETQPDARQLPKADPAK